jgi:anti-anti-sigma regulatory factor
VIAANVQSAASGYRVELTPAKSRAYPKDVQHGVKSALDRGERRIVVDCAAWSEMDLALLAALVGCARVCDREGAEFDLANLRSDMRSMIDALRLSGRLGLVE